MKSRSLNANDTVSILKIVQIQMFGFGSSLLPPANSGWQLGGALLPRRNRIFAVREIRTFVKSALENNLYCGMRIYNIVQI